MRNDTPLARQWIVLRTLAARHAGVAVQELAQELDIGLRTIRRDLALLQSVGFPLEERVVDRGRKLWSLKPSAQPALTFSLDEALALYVSRRFLEPLAGTLLWEAAQTAFRKVRATLDNRALAYLDRMAGQLHHTSLGQSDYAPKSELIDELMQGIEGRRVTIIAYRSLKATEPVTYEVCPYGVVYHRGSLYLVAFSRDHDEVRHFKVDRMSEAEATAFPFPWPEDFDLTQHLAGSFGIYDGRSDVTVRVRFQPRVARYVQESHWHASQQLTPQPDGSLLAQFRLSNTAEFKSWLLSFGRHAVVLAPDSLRQEILDEARAMTKAYRVVPVDPRRPTATSRKRKKA